MPIPADEFALHQVPLSLAQVATSDRNAYDRWYFNAHDRSGEVFLVTGFGVYPNLGVQDAFAAVRRNDTQRTVRCSDATDDDRLHPRVGPYRIEVVEPLQRVRVVCDTPRHGLAFDLTFHAAVPALDEERHVLRAGRRSIIDSARFAQLGRWSGVLAVDGADYQVDPETWVGSRDRSWGIRPVGEAEPPGRPADDASAAGFWWLYVPLLFDSYAVVVIAQEDGDGHRSLNQAVRVWPDGRLDQLGWPRVRITYRPGTRDPVSAQIQLTEPDGSPFVLAVSPSCGVPLHVGCGYGGDPEWTHGSWRGRGWLASSVYDLSSPQLRARLPWGVTDYVARATVGDAVGWGLFEHGTIGRHRPSGFADLAAVAAGEDGP